jgi:hypothetical protein
MTVDCFFCDEPGCHVVKLAGNRQYPRLPRRTTPSSSVSDVWLCRDCLRAIEDSLRRVIRRLCQLRLKL